MEEHLSEEKKVFNLARVRTTWHEYVARKRTYKAEKNYLDEAGDLFKELARGAEVLSLDGQEVAKIVSGQLNKSLLAKEQPDIVEECTVTTTVKRFDPDLFKQKYPDLFKQYQAKRLVVDPGVLGFED